MSELSISKFLRERESERGAMESCYKLYTWISHTILMLLLQIFWKMSQISDYFKEKNEEEKKTEPQLTFSPLTKESKQRRHIRSMSDVHCSTPFKIAFRSRLGSSYSLAYDSDTRSRRANYRRLRDLDSSDSSDYSGTPIKSRNVEHGIMKHIDSMRIL